MKWSLILTPFLLGLVTGCGGDDDGSPNGKVDGAKVAADSGAKVAADSGAKVAADSGAKVTADSGAKVTADSGTAPETCTDLCKQAQSGSCTDVKGDCGSFCQAVNSAKGPAGCTSQYDAYQNCLGSTAKVCDADCDSAENALRSCFTAYCATRLQDKDCLTMLASFL